MKRTRKRTGHDSRFPKNRTTSDALEIVDHYVIGDDEKLRDKIHETEFELEVGQLVYDVRTAAGLTQAELAKLIGSNQSVVSRLEAADYNGHSLSMLRRIADALNQRLTISFSRKNRPSRRSA